jgi:hypothetical protein
MWIEQNINGNALLQKEKEGSLIEKAGIII